MKLWQQSMIYLARNTPVKDFIQNRSSMSQLAVKFVAGRNLTEVTEKSRTLNSQGYKASLFYLGEYVEDMSIINETVSQLKAIAQELAKQSADIHISVDPTQIGYSIDEKTCRDNAFQIAEEIKNRIDEANNSVRNFLMLDMEDSSVTDATIRLYADLRKAFLPAAVTLQAYLYRTTDDLDTFIQNGGAVRLVKGAFAESKEIAFTKDIEIDRNFMKLAQSMLSYEARENSFYPIFGTHDDNLIARIIEVANNNGWEKEEYEFEMLYGVRTQLQQNLVSDGIQLRLYLPFGMDWWPYAVRRVGESPKNARFLVRSLFSSNKNRIRHESRNERS